MVNVEWDLAAFRRAKFVGREGAHMELHVDDEPEPGAALRLLSQAVDVANDVLAAEEAAGREMYGLVDAVAPGPHGPVARFKECEPAAALRLYLSTLTSTLEELGVAGRLLPVAPKIDDRWYGNNTFGALAAVLQLPVDVAGFLADWRSSTSGPHSSWWVDESHTEAVLEPVLTWVLDAGDNLQMTVGLTHSRPHRSEAWALLVAGLRLGAQVFVRADDGPSRMRGLYAPAFGDVLVHSYEPSRPRTSHLETLVGLLRTCAPELRGGWVQEADTAAIARNDLLTRVPPVHPLMQRVGNTAWLLFDLEHDHVVDAFVAQVLNDAKLANTHDLSVARWQVTEIGPDRHLVVARNPAPWFDHDPLPLPQRPGYDNAWRRSPINAVDDDTLAQARADFGDAIMKLETLEQHPFVEPSSG